MTAASDIAAIDSGGANTAAEVRTALTSVLTEGTAPGDWNAPTLLNSWADYGLGFQESRWRQDETGTVHLEGLIKDGTPGPTSVAFVLPDGSRPDATLIFITKTDGGVSDIRVSSDGNVRVQSGSSNWTSLSGISFLGG